MELIHNCLTEQQRLQLVKSEVYTNIEMGDYRFWEGWWKSDPKDQIEETLMHLWKGKIDESKYQSGGIEYWVNRITGEHHGQWHQDIVETADDDNVYGKYYVPGDMSMVYYPYIHELKGGYLELADLEQPVSKADFRIWLRKLDPINVERVKPRQNMAVLYNSSRVHRVAPVYSGRRDALASTVWHNTPETFKHKPGVNPNDDRHDEN